MAIANKSTIQSFAELGCSVLLDINDGDRMTFARLHSTSTLKIGNVKCSLDSLVGQPFGAVFEMHSERSSARLVRVAHINPDIGGKEDKLLPDERESTEDVRERDNRALVDNNTAQTLSSDDIERMKRNGASGKQIINALVANSASFETKTAFSQEKYMKKKQKKYAPRVLLRRPSARSICEAYFVKDPRKIGFCRMDTLALMLCLGNVGPNSDILVLDTLGGLITAAVAERVGGHGSICSTYYTTKRPPIDMVRLLNLDDSTNMSVLRARLGKLIAARNSTMSLPCTAEENHNNCFGERKEALSGGDHVHREKLETSTINSVAAAATECKPDDTKSVTQQLTPIEVSGSMRMDVDEDSTSNLQVEDGPKDVSCQPCDSEADAYEGKNDAVTNKGVRPGNEASSNEILRWASQGFTSLLVAAPEVDPWTAVEQLLPLLSSSSPFVIYNQYQQPLAECMHLLQKNNMAVALQLTEPWSREYQVLPLRTHPHMQMSATGGFVLSGIRIVTSP